jgi:hypothetical protein
MTRRKVFFLCLLGLALVGGVVLILRDPVVLGSGRDDVQ